jgi:hypothetical protein
MFGVATIVRSLRISVNSTLAASPGPAPKTRKTHAAHKLFISEDKTNTAKPNKSGFMHDRAVSRQNRRRPAQAGSII